MALLCALSPTALLSKELTWRDKGVLVALGSFAGSTELVWPSNIKLSEITGLDTKTIQKTLAKLKLGGWITQCQSPQGGRAFNLVGSKLTTGGYETHPTGGQNIGPQNVPTEGAKHHLGGYETHPTGGMKRTPELSNELSNEDIIKKTKNPTDSKRGSRLSEDWVVSYDEIEFARSEGWNDAAINNEADTFKDYWLSVAGAKGVKIDWSRTWKNWIRNSRNPKQRNDTYQSRSLSCAGSGAGQQGSSTTVDDGYYSDPTAQAILALRGDATRSLHDHPSGSRDYKTIDHG